MTAAATMIHYTQHVTHEQFIQTVRDLAVKYSTGLSTEALSRVARAKLLYGRGHFGLRGVTQYGGWQNGDKDELIEVCAASEEHWVQLAGTTIHELAHAATGIGHGHGKSWKQACAGLGLRVVYAAGTDYKLANFSPALRFALVALDKPADGAPLNALTQPGGLANIKARPCAAGVGVRGGKSRGPGSGSRLRKYVCDGFVDAVPHGQIIRASTDTLDATCNVCGGLFVLQ